MTSADPSSANPNFILALLRSRKRFEALRQFTLESGQAEIERQSRQRKDRSKEASNTSNSAHSPTDASRQRSSLQDVPEESSAFAIGDDEDSDDGGKPATASPSTQNSRQASVSSSIDDTVPLQLRGMSEKARGKLPAGAPSVQRQNSSTALSRSNTLSNFEGGFRPTPEWVSLHLHSPFYFTIIAHAYDRCLGGIMGAGTAVAYHPHPDF